MNRQLPRQAAATPRHRLPDITTVMTAMMTALTVAAATCGFAPFTAQDANASSRRGRFIRPPRVIERDPASPADMRMAKTPDAAGDKTPLMMGPSNAPGTSGVPQVRVPLRPAPGWERYPKFQGGFHSRQLQDLGVPTGDQGLRGNGFSMYPW